MNHSHNKTIRMSGYFALLGMSIAAVCYSGAIFAQSGGMGHAGMLQEKLAAIKTSTAENQQKLHQYTWTETSDITVNGNSRPSKISTCSYGPDGKVHKVPVGGMTENASSEGGRRGRFKQRIIANKTAEMKDYMQQVGHVLQLYVPPNPQKMEQAFKQKKVSFGRNNGLVDLVFKDYALRGDSMTVGFDPAAKKIRTLSVQTYLDTPQDPVTLVVDFSSLPDGTNHPSRTTLDAQLKGIRVVNTNSNYRKSVM
ncbi:MAG: hypothetical protein ACREPU_07305 [Rhodanobacteraceae bacterium]